MKVDDFDYSLPEELIAQYPPEKRGDSRLLVYNRDREELSHHHFSEIVNYFNSDDLLIFNDTRVFPARLLGHKESGGKVEVLLVKELEKGMWEALVKASRSPSSGAKLHLEGGIVATVHKKLETSVVLLFKSPEELLEAVEKHGRVPLPPYISREPDSTDKDRYQTIFAKKEGAVAAPTAGLHFNEKIMDAIEKRVSGVETITLHVGPGTFQPVRVENIDAHKMHSEFFELKESTAEKINDAKNRGGRIIAVGTTVVRALESSFSGGKVLPKSDWTDIFIRPEFTFNVADSMVTNFHLPKSTLFMLVSAFAGREKLKKIYADAVREKYSFFSYGDAMLIL